MELSHQPSDGEMLGGGAGSPDAEEKVKIQGQGRRLPVWIPRMSSVPDMRIHGDTIQVERDPMVGDFVGGGFLRCEF